MLQTNTLINEYLNAINTISKKYRLTLNTLKSQLILFDNKCSRNRCIRLKQTKMDDIDYMCDVNLHLDIDSLCY